MESIFRRLLNAGIGVASKTTRFAEDLINDLVQKGKFRKTKEGNLWKISNVKAKNNARFLRRK
jgi:polyhydroxyalkanoate synthesis regulator phasin